MANYFGVYAGPAIRLPDAPGIRALLGDLTEDERLSSYTDDNDSRIYLVPNAPELGNGNAHWRRAGDNPPLIDPDTTTAGAQFCDALGEDFIAALPVGAEVFWGVFSYCY